MPAPHMLALWLACAPGPRGEAGAPGADGADGAPGEDGADGLGMQGRLDGVVQGAAGPAAGVPVALWMLDEDGQPLGPIGGAVTDSSGAFSLRMADVAPPQIHLMLFASTPEGELRSFAYDAEISVDAATTAVAEIVGAIVETAGGRALSDFSPAEIVALHAAAEQALADAGTDRADAGAVYATVLEAVGGAVAEASGGGWSATASTLPIDADPPDLVTAGAGERSEAFYDGLDFRWSIVTRDAYLSSTDHDAFYNLGYLHVEGVTFLDPLRVYTFEDGRELVIGPIYDAWAPFLAVSREFMVATGGGYVRITEVLHNTSSADITVAVELESRVGPGDDDRVQFSSSGDQALDPADHWYIGDHTLVSNFAAQVFPGAEATKTLSRVTLSWGDVRVPAGATVRITHWALQRAGELDAALNAELAQAVSASTGAFHDPAWYEGLSQAEVESNIAPLLAQNVFAEAGFLAPDASFTLSNDDTGGSVSALARSDGSFSEAFLARPGDTLRVVASDGTHQTLTIP